MALVLKPQGWDLPGGPVLKLHLPVQGRRVASPTRELRPHMPQSYWGHPPQVESPCTTVKDLRGAAKIPCAPPETQGNQNK